MLSGQDWREYDDRSLEPQCQGLPARFLIGPLVYNTKASHPQTKAQRLIKRCLLLLDVRISPQHEPTHNQATLLTSQPDTSATGFPFKMTMEIPSLAPNAFYLACHAVLILPQIFLGIRYKTWGYLFGMFCGHVLEIVGYVARVQMHNGKDGFLAYIVCLTIAPAFFSAAIYLCLARIISVYGHNLSRFSPRTYTITFMVSDLVALILQAAGGAILGGDDTPKSTLDTGLAIIKTGLAAHLVSIAVFMALAAEYGFRAYRHQIQWSPRFSDLQDSRRFSVFLIGIATATIFILIRTSFRMAELQNGFDSKLANDEAAFIALEGAMIAIATLCLAISHPGIAFQGRWAEADFQLRKDNKGRDLQKTDSDPISLNSV
ncbi:hypothetical protein AK830_g8351 [Neonectria ditissima]|uniref:Sphingoid long-chain base transporter RSB1 n=1 Tax=Neonectria ditissima TaxID=78410 RepID=A0A0P7AXN0_9HYPO|nr:hypothetical protein AK830_g8351 [Neonectria ditissima]